MPFHYLNELLDLPEVTIVNIDVKGDHAIIEVTSLDSVQECPYCHSSSVIRNGQPYSRDVHHLAAFDKSVDIRIPAFNLKCKECGATFYLDILICCVKKTLYKCLFCFFYPANL